ncbi:DHH family phosphoesterase [Chitinispirillales bacterium ANBcel5]|uniref:DHH family phosphoesterase n=1 Tax=Cellulosispirillum alkaliphilum TaxID=3039283 RepID=UPI002A595E3C|nr:DHH family phosphoesterase [Chitinispirillales bacterium ANBcel5]
MSEYKRDEEFKVKIEELKKKILPASTALILTHDYPDPDCLASAFGLSHLLSYWGVKSTLISFGGFVGRAENRAMIRYLNINTVPFVLTEIEDFDRILLVDSFPGKGNVSLPQFTPIHAVIDHHPSKIPDDARFFHHIRTDIGATSTIITRYLLESDITINKDLATALFYGIKTDTGDMRREVSEFDIECYKYLFERIDHQILSKIENPDRDLEYFRILHRATEAAVYFDDVGYTHLGQVTTPDYVAEMTDLFHSLERLEWMICSGVFKCQIFFSIRTKNGSSAGMRAEELAKRLKGSGGGHSRAAAGRVPITKEQSNKSLDDFVLTLKEVFGVGDQEAEKLL